MNDEIEERQEEQVSPRDVPNLDPIFDDIQELANTHGITDFVLSFRLEGIEKTLIYWRNEKLSQNNIRAVAGISGHY